MISHIDRLISIAQDIGLPSEAAQLSYIKQRIANENCELILPLVGEFSAGKTTLINSLTDAKQLETATKPTTATIFEIHFGCDSCYAEVYDDKGGKMRVDDMSSLKNENLGDSLVVNVFDTSTRIPSNIVLVDTPGLSSEDPRHRQTLIDFLPDDEQTSERITLYEVHSPQKDKLETLKQLLLGFGDASSIVFLNYRESVERVNSYLVEQGFTTSCFHGGLEQRQREDALYRFSNGSANVLVSTDLASRGLDIPNIENIIHYHLPESEDGYIHRVGRTARWDATGRSFFILNSEEHIPEYVEGDVEEYVATESQHTVPVAPKMATIYIGKGKKDKISKGDIVGFLCKSGGLKADEIGRIDVKDRYAYVAVKRQKLQQVLRQTRGEKIKGIKTIVEEVR